MAKAKKNECLTTMNDYTTHIYEASELSLRAKDEEVHIQLLLSIWVWKIKKFVLESPVIKIIFI